MFKARYGNINGPTTTLELGATTTRGAKIEAYRRAAGDANIIILLQNGNLVATRTARDLFYGFCRGANRWE